jgi:protocatechuate 4,5-dioxygenase beta chain
MMFEPKERWNLTFERVVPETGRESLPYAAKQETEEVIEGYIERINRAFDVLKQQIEAYRPDAIIMIGDDQGDVYDMSNNPTFSMFLGDELWGLSGTLFSPREERQRIVFPCHAELSRYIHKGLVKRGFDIAWSEQFKPVGRPENGVSHMIAHLMPRVTPDLDIPIVPVFLNEYFPPLPTATRCWDLGVAIADILADRPERVAIYASGGLSHDPRGPRSGWVDEPLDRWVLERLERNDGEALKSLFTFDSDTMRSGTGEIRAWISVAGAMRRPAKIVDYVPAHHTLTGLGWAYWEPVEAPRAGSPEAREAVGARG